MTARIHATAVVDPRAEIAEDVTVGAFCVVGPGVTLGRGVEVGHHVVLEGRVVVGPDVRIGHGAALGGAPQDLKFDPGTPSGVRVGTGTVIREYVTIHRATRAESWTEIGPRCLLMGLTHVGHDCRLGEGVILVNYAGLSGHCELEDFVTIGGQSGCPPFTRVGTYGYLGGFSKLEADLPPYMLANGVPATVHGINGVGLRRAGMPAAERRALKDAHRILYRGGLAPGPALARLRTEGPAGGAVERLVAFVAASTRRGICAPPGGWRAGAASPAEDAESERVGR
ncbi:MAG: acyl-ACP--UDP-N-acetylglucosamine O-acyltransferase [Candidatus Rokuibacteriota bacterium]